MSPFSVLSLAGNLFGLASATWKAAAPAEADSFQALLAERLRGSPEDATTALFGQSGAGGLPFAGTPGGAASPLLARLGTGGGVAGLSSLGRNLSLSDPESGYRMMSGINQRDVTYQAQFAELSAMQAAVATMQQAGKTLGEIDAASDAGSDGATLKAKLQTFASRYNEWIGRFAGSVEQGGVLDGTQAAEVSLYELEQSVENPFNGAMRGLHGLRDLGFTIDQTSNLAHFDTATFDAALQRNRQGVLDTIGEFSANFAKSASLLNASDNFIPRQLNNLDGVIDYIADNLSALRSEFGRGDPARPTPQIARALAAYQQLPKA